MERALPPLLKRTLDLVREWTEPSLECPCCDAMMHRLFIRHLRYVWRESRRAVALSERSRSLPEGLYVECHHCGEWTAFEPYVGMAVGIDA